MVRVAVIAVSLALVTVCGILFIRHVTSVPVSEDLMMPTPDGFELEVFQEVIRARQKAGIGSPVPGRAGALTTPTGSHKGAAKKQTEARRQTAKLLANIAVSRGMTLEDVEEIYRRGKAENWPIGTTR